VILEGSLHERELLRHSPTRPRIDRRLKAQPQIPWKIDPSVLADFCDEGVDERAAKRLRIDRRVMRFRYHGADDARGGTGVAKVVHHEHARAAAAERGDLRADRL